MTGGPHLPSEPRRRRRHGVVVAVLAVLGLLAGQAPASGQQAPGGQSAPPDARPCTGQKSASRDSCANLPLDAYRNTRPVEAAPAPPPTLNPLRPVGRPAVLANARIGQPYPAAQLVIGGTRPYSVRTYGLPPSLRVNADGFLVGLPAPGEAGDYPFGVVVQDGAGQEIRQLYRLRITGGGGGAPVARRPEPPRPGPVLSPIKVPDTRAEPASIDGRVTVYVLRNADLLPPKPAAPVLAAGAAAAPPANVPPPPPPPPPPSVVRSASEKVTIILPLDTPQSAAYPTALATRAKALVNVEYPSRDLFEHALAASYAPEILSRTQLEKVADAATEYRYFARAPKLNWAPEAGCGCASPIGLQNKTVYGFFPFWRSEEPPPAIVFSKVSRIGFLGVQLGNDGSWTRPSGYSAGVDLWWRQTSTFARAAQAHGARLDLVLQRSDWGFLTRMDAVERTALYESAARTAVGLADTRLRNRGAGMLLLPFWREPKYVFDGITVMFDYTKGASAEELDAYIHFHDGFIRELIREMQASKREYVLNIVAPDPLGATSLAQGMGGAMSEASIWRAFLAYKRMAEPQRFHRAAPPEDKARFIGRTKIRVNLLAPVREPTGASKKALRASIDGLTDVRGYNRVAVLQSILPIVYLPGGEGPFEETPPGVKAKPKPKGKPVVRTKADKTQFDDDIIYYRQNFGGVALWPAPVQKVGISDEVYDDLQRIFYQTDSGPLAAVTSQVICSLVLRLLWQALALATLVAGIAYVVWGQGSGRAKVYRRGLLTLGVALFGLSFFLLTVDPALAALSRSNLPLFGLVAVALGGAGWRAAKPKIPRP